MIAGLPTIADIAVEGVAYHFDAPYSYLISEALRRSARPGCRVMVPFGRGNRKRQGLILRVRDASDLDDVKGLKTVADVVDKEPLFSEEMLALVSWLKETTFCTLYEAAKTMLPAGIGLKYVVSYMADTASSASEDKLTDEEKAVLEYLRGQAKFVTREKLMSACGLAADSPLPDKLVKKGLVVSNVDACRKTGDLTVKNVRLAVDEATAEEVCTGLTAKQKSVLKLLLDIGSASVREVCYFTGVTAGVVTALVKKGLAELYDAEVYRRPQITGEPIPAPPLTAEQKAAFETLCAKYREGKPAASLLFGVTGSGKTQVFLRLIEEVVKDGRGVIVMVPEIALTPQTLRLFYGRFGDSVAVFHSALSAGERIDEWKRVKNGEAKIAVGTRSAVFAPFDNLGLIVMDEEQEHTYKSERAPRYHARDVARFRCAQSNASLVLSSATPSLETYARAMDGRYGLVKLTARYGKAVLPDVVTIDTTDCKTILSGELCRAVEECLDAGKQAILLMNRRGYNTFAVCRSCKSVIMCPNCSTSLTYHSANRRLMCHHCGHSQPYTDVCPTCGERTMQYSGYGTQRIEDELAALFPKARILRMDADTTMAKYSYQEKLSAFADGEYDIMLGTQMVAKGLDFPRVTLVGIVSVDQQLFNDDFRAGETAFDLLTQVIGRSGRAETAGKAYIQTMLPDNEIIALAAKQDFEHFYKTESVIRKSLLYPPYCEMCVLTFVSDSLNRSMSGAGDFRQMLVEAVGERYQDVTLELMEPVRPRLGKINNKYRTEITVKCRNNKRFRELIAETLTAFMKSSREANVSVSVDINPLN